MSREEADEELCSLQQVISAAEGRGVEGASADTGITLEAARCTPSRSSTGVCVFVFVCLCVCASVAIAMSVEAFASALCLCSYGLYSAWALRKLPAGLYFSPQTYAANDIFLAAVWPLNLFYTQCSVACDDSWYVAQA